MYPPETFFLYSSGLWRYMAAASPFKGSIGLGYVRSCGRKLSNILERSEKQEIINSRQNIISDISTNNKRELPFFGILVIVISLGSGELPIPPNQIS